MPTQTIRAASSRLAAAVVMTPAAAARLVEKMWRGHVAREFFHACRRAALTLQADFRVMRAKRFARDAKIEVRRQHMVSHWELLQRRREPAHPASDWAKHGGKDLELHLYYTDLIDLRWLVKLGRKRGRLPKWQDLPTEAKVPLGELRRSYGGWGLPILALSYPWHSKHHPDPQGSQLQQLLPLLEAVQEVLDEREAVLKANLPPAQADGAPAHHLTALGSWDGGKPLTWGVLWDFGSLPQYGCKPGDAGANDKYSEEQQADNKIRFKTGLSKINAWCVVRPPPLPPRVWTVLLNSKIPPGAENDHPYCGRGWCIFERAVSSHVKDAHCLLAPPRPPEKAVGRLGAAPPPPRVAGWALIEAWNAKERDAPYSPDDFNAMMTAGVKDASIKFTNGTDLSSIVEPNYKEGFVSAFKKENLTLNYVKLRWQREQAERLARALLWAGNHGCLALQHLHLGDNHLTDAGAAAIVRALATHEGTRHLRELQLDDCSLGDDAAVALAEALHELGGGELSTLDLQGNAIAVAGATALARAIGGGGASHLSLLFLGGNRIGDGGCAALAAALPAAARLQFLQLQQNEIGDAGAARLADAFGGGAMGALRQLRLDGNQIGDDGCASLADAFDALGESESAPTGLVDFRVQGNPAANQNAVLVSLKRFRARTVSGRSPRVSIRGSKHI